MELFGDGSARRAGLELLALIAEKTDLADTVVDQFAANAPSFRGLAQYQAYLAEFIRLSTTLKTGVRQANVISSF